MKHILLQVGCIHCGLGSSIVGVFENVFFADSLSDYLNEHHEELGSGMNNYIVLEMPEDNTINPFFLELLPPEIIQQYHTAGASPGEHNKQIS